MGCQPRRKPLWTPQFDGPIKGWVINYLRRNFWKVASSHEYEDLIQDAWLYFWRCKEKYPRIIDPPHFMQIFKLSYERHFQVLQRRQYKHFSIERDQRVRTQAMVSRGGGRDYNWGPLLVLLNRAPESLKFVMNELVEEVKNTIDSTGVGGISVSGTTAVSVRKRLSSYLREGS